MIVLRVWHKSLIPVLPREQLIAQWRECSAIAGAILKNGTPNHILVNKVLDYDFNHFITYSLMIRKEMTRRGYRTMQSVEDKICGLKPNYEEVDFNYLFAGWHENKYFKQCYYNLEEKYDCGGILKEDFEKIYDLFYEL